MSLKLVFMGTPDFSVPTLAALAAAGYEICAVYTQPPRPAGRGMAERKSHVHLFAEDKGLAVRSPRNFKDPETRDAFSALAPDAVVVVAYGLLLPRTIIEAPRLGCYNLHASALPRWRGAAPIQRAILAGDTSTAVMVMRMDEGLDTGAICAEKTLPISPDATAGELHDALAAAGAPLMVAALADLEAGRLRARPQPGEGVTYARKIDKAEARIDFSRPAHEVHNQIRGLSPFPGAWFETTSPAGVRERIKVLSSRLVPGAGTPGAVLDGALTIACGADAVSLIEVQRAGKRPMAADEFLRGFPLAPGARLDL